MLNDSKAPLVARWRAAAVLLAAVVGALLVGARPAAAIPTEGNGCLETVGGAISASPATVTVGQSTTLSWQATAGTCRVRLSVTAVGAAQRKTRSGCSGEDGAYPLAGLFAFLLLTTLFP